MSEKEEQRFRKIKPIVTPSPEADGSGSVPGEKQSLGMFEKFVWGFVLIFSFIWIFVPEPTDAVPVLGWLDEGFAFMMVITALDRFGIRVPFLEKMVWKGWGKKAGPEEKDVTPPKG